MLSVDILEALREMVPSIHWRVVCYSIETKYSMPNPNKKVILWLDGKEEDCFVLKKAGYSVKCLKSEWVVVNHLCDPMNSPKIAAIILPFGQVIGFTHLQRSITNKFKEAREKFEDIVP